MQNLVKNAELGQVVFGFELIKKEYVESIDSKLYTFRHVKTGAELLYSDRKDDNKSFAITFTTLPEDSTGVFHILEHSVLCGSDKYPVKEPFVNLLQSSMQTFLNAMTFPDKTAYPVSSRNEQDFFNLMSVYLDAVFCPKIYSKPEIFMQEGWHYEMDDVNSPVTYNGVVFSEMKGSFSNVDRMVGEETCRLLFPDNCYGYISGGFPENIPDLTYEQFIDTHKRFYHPSNSKIFLDGSMDADAVFKYIDEEYLSKYDYRERDFAFTLQKPVREERTVNFAVNENDESFAHMSLAKIFCRYDDIEKIYAASIICDYLTGTNESPLKRAILEKNLGQDVSAELNDGIYQPYVNILVRNTKEDKFEEIKTTIVDTVKKLVSEGLNKKVILSTLERAAFASREIQEPYGLTLALKALDTWLYGGDPTTHWNGAEIYASLREKVNTGYFEELLDELFGTNDDKAVLYAIPSATKAEEDLAKEKARLEKECSAWGKDERQSVFDSYTALTKWQKSSDSPEALATLPRLNLSDIPLIGSKTETEERVIGGRRALYVKNNTNGIVYLNLYFNVDDLDLEELRLLTILSEGLGELSTENYSAEDLQSEIKTKLGSIDFRLDFIAPDGVLDDCTPYFCVSASMLEENEEGAFELIKELLLRARYDESSKISEMLIQTDYFAKQSLISSGHTYAMKKALSPFSLSSSLKEALEGESYVRWFSPFASSFMDNADKITSAISELHKRVFVSDRLFIGYNGRLKDALIEDLISSLPVGKKQVKAVHSFDFDKENCSIEIAAGVSYSAIGGNLFGLGKSFTGAASVLSSLTSFGYLWNAVRVQGGAYGTGMRIRSNGDMICYSYRDPNLEGTVNAYKGISSFLEGFLDSGAPLDDIIIGTVNTTEPLLSPESVCQFECGLYLKGSGFDNISRIRKEILTTTRDHIRDLIDAVHTFSTEGKFCGVGNSANIKFIEK